MNRELETDGVPAPSDFELGTWVSDDDGPPYAELRRLYEAARTLILDWQTRNDALTAERDGYRAVAEQRAAENARLRGALDQVDELLEHLQSVEELLKKSWNINKTRQWIATALAPHGCAGDYCEACDKCVGA